MQGIIFLTLCVYMHVCVLDCAGQNLQPAPVSVWKYATGPSKHNSIITQKVFSQWLAVWNLTARTGVAFSPFARHLPTTAKLWLTSKECNWHLLFASFMCYGKQVVVIQQPVPTGWVQFSVVSLSIATDDDDFLIYLIGGEPSLHHLWCQTKLKKKHPNPTY